MTKATIERNSNIYGTSSSTSSSTSSNNDHSKRTDKTLIRLRIVIKDNFNSSLNVN